MHRKTDQNLLARTKASCIATDVYMKVYLYLIPYHRSRFPNMSGFTLLALKQVKKTKGELKKKVSLDLVHFFWIDSHRWSTRTRTASVSLQACWPLKQDVSQWTSVKNILVGLSVTCYIPLDLEHPELLEYQMHPNKIQNIQFIAKKKTV